MVDPNDGNRESVQTLGALDSIGPVLTDLYLKTVMNLETVLSS
jgi:hypothetical protein